jgi:hypothetical protein
MLTDPLLPGLEVLQAHYIRYRYAPHWHDAVCVAVVGAGAAAFDCSRARHVAPAGSVFVIPAYEVHTGEPAADAGLAPHAYQVQLRVLQAKRLLAAGHSIAETAAECGFLRPGAPHQPLQTACRRHARHLRARHRRSFPLRARGRAQPAQPARAARTRLSVAAAARGQLAQIAARCSGRELARLLRAGQLAAQFALWSGQP